MPMHPDFPTDPHAVIPPDVRWHPSGARLAEVTDPSTLLPPLVGTIRERVHDWRAGGYQGASPTSEALLRHWFGGFHLMESSDGTTSEFGYYFAQREAVETAVWLYEVEKAHDPYSLLRYDASGRVSMGMFLAHWPRYVFKLATGAGKTKVLSLLIAWAYFHKTYEENSPLSTNFMLVAPNIIVLDRLLEDFRGLSIFRTDPVLPPNGYAGKSWRDDFQISLHVQDDIGHISNSGNLFLTNIHRVYENPQSASHSDEDLTDYFLGAKPTGRASDNRIDLGSVIRDLSDLVVLNDEAHHIHDTDLAWFRTIEDIESRLRQKGGSIAAQFDVTATPKHDSGAIFVDTVCSYPLVEAIKQGVVKTPVVPDAESRRRLREGASDRVAERYADHIKLGYLEWRKKYDEFLRVGKKAVLFVMTAETKDSNEVAEYLERTFPDLDGKVLVIHTKANGFISESDSKRAELDRLRKAAAEIDSPLSPYLAVVSVLMLREGWDVKNVVAMVGLRPYGQRAKILPEQTLGRGLRRMFRGDSELMEYVSIVGTEGFMDFVQEISEEGVELEQVPMGPDSTPRQPLVIEVDMNSEEKNIAKLDIEVPVLTPRVTREYRNLVDLDVNRMQKCGLRLREFSPEEARIITFKEAVEGNAVVWTTDLGQDVLPTSQAVISFLTNLFASEMRLVGGKDILYQRMRDYITQHLFDSQVSLTDANVLKNLTDTGVQRRLFDVLKSAVNKLTVEMSESTSIAETLLFSKTRPHVVSHQDFITSKKSVFNRVVGDSNLELLFASFLEECEDIQSYVKNSRSTHFKIEYIAPGGTIANYFPDFVVKESESTMWIVETKGKEDLDVVPKWQRLVAWCADATALDRYGRTFRALYIPERDYLRNPPRTFAEAVSYFEGARPSSNFRQLENG